MNSDRRMTVRDLSGLRAALNDWDPIGGVPEDEYDCIQWPLVSQFRRGASRSEVEEFLRDEVRDHYGIDASVPDETVDRLFAWWSSAGVS